MASRKPSPKPKVRLQRFLADCGVGSRRSCEEIIRSGRVTVNGTRISEMGVSVDPSSDQVDLDGRRLTPQSHVYMAVHKPAGVLCSSSDPQGRRVVLDLLPPLHQRVYTIGRLDLDSEGLILVTNDGEFAHRLTHPRHHVRKIYQVWSNRPVEPAHIERMLAGMEIEGERMRVLEIRESHHSQRHVRYRVTLGEGKKRQIRRMFREVGCRVIRLKRTQVGSVRLGDMEPGHFRTLSSQEVDQLRRDAEV